MRRVRRAIGEEGRKDRSAKIAERVLALPAWKDAETVALFVPMRTEVDVTLLRDAALAQGKAIAAPRMIEVLGEDPKAPPRLSLELRSWDRDVEPIESGRMVKEPPASAGLVPPDTVDLVIVPALALDPTGGRVGYGAGLYDGLLPSLRRALRVAVAYEFQLVLELPLAPHDERVHHIVTDERSVAATGAAP